MICKFLVKMNLVLLVGVALWCTTALAGSQSLPLRHPEQDEDVRTCTDCHDAGEGDIAYRRFNHTLFFGDRHRFAATGNTRLCEMCHRPSFCADCHGVRQEIKPSLRHGTSVRRRMPHRGDYLTRHRIDGRINPTACFGCHGRPKSAATCAPCHR